MRSTVDEPTGGTATVPIFDRIEDGPAWLGPVIIAVLSLDALITLALEVLYLPAYLGTLSLPLSAILAGVVNVLLVLGVRTITDSTGVTLLPVAVWTFGFLACTVGGPGGDIMLVSDWRTLLLLVCGLAPPLLYAYFRVNAIASAEAVRSDRPVQHRR